MAEFGKTLGLIDLNNKDFWAISNIDINVAKNLGLTSIQKHWRLTEQIKKKVNGLYRDWIPVLTVFVKYSRKMHDNKKVTENMKIRWDIDPGLTSSLFFQL